jgi:hypothetical protein
MLYLVILLLVLLFLAMVIMPFGKARTQAPRRTEPSRGRPSPR